MSDEAEETPKTPITDAIKRAAEEKRLAEVAASQGVSDEVKRLNDLQQEANKQPLRRRIVEGAPKQKSPAK